MNLVDATVHSVNTVYAQLILDVGPAYAVSVARRMGVASPLLAYPSALTAGAEPLVGYLGKFIPQKGVHDLLTALPRLGGAVNPVLVGFGSFREWLAGLVSALRGGDAAAQRWLEER